MNDANNLTTFFNISAIFNSMTYPLKQLTVVQQQQQNAILPFLLDNVVYIHPSVFQTI